jgi:26S proteasome regulatory subunit N5
MRWPGIEAIYGPTLRESSVFSQSIAEGEADDGTKRWNALHQRVIEHVSSRHRDHQKVCISMFDLLHMQNIRVVASYYTQITLPRLTELLDLSAAEAERTLCRLVTDKVVRAKIDRPAGIVDFSPRSNPDEILNAWSGDLGKMLGLIEKTSHLINKASPFHSFLRTAYADQTCRDRSTRFMLHELRWRTDKASRLYPLGPLTTLR